MTCVLEPVLTDMLVHHEQYSPAPRQRDARLNRIAVRLPRVPRSVSWGLHKSYGDVRAVDGVDLVIAPGEVVALLGPNGAGKSTTVDMLLGLTKPDAGEVASSGRPPHDAIANGTVGAMLQEGSLLEDATVGETIAMIASLHRSPMPVAEAMRRAGVEDLAERRSTKLSGGQKQRVRFAVALVCDPHLLVLDEPTSAMDVGTRREFWQSMQEFTDAGKTVLFATHYLDEAEEFADRVVMMRAGRVIADGSVAEVRAAASGRTLTAQVPGATADAEMRALPGVSGVELRGTRVELDCADSDAAVRALIAGYPQAHDIEIKAVGLEEAFLALTSDDEEHPMKTAYLALEARRALRNPRFLFFTMVFPVVIFLIDVGAFGKGNVPGSNVTYTAYLMAEFGRVRGVHRRLNGGARTAVERASGWQRQLRLTPLTPRNYLLAQGRHRHAGRAAADPAGLGRGCAVRARDPAGDGLAAGGPRRVGGHDPVRGPRVAGRPVGHVGDHAGVHQRPDDPARFPRRHPDSGARCSRTGSRTSPRCCRVTGWPTSATARCWATPTSARRCSGWPGGRSCWRSRWSAAISGTALGTDGTGLMEPEWVPEVDVNGDEDKRNGWVWPELGTVRDR